MMLEKGGRFTHLRPLRGALAWPLIGRFGGTIWASVVVCLGVGVFLRLGV